MLTKNQITKMRKGINIGSEDLSLIFGTLGDRGRLLILRLLMKNSDICVTDVANVLEISVPAASHQLKILEMAGFVRKKRAGQTTCYKVKNDDLIIKSVIKLLNKIKGQGKIK